MIAIIAIIIGCFFGIFLYSLLVISSEGEAPKLND